MRCKTFACGYPSGECQGSCHKVNTAFIDRRREAVAIKGRVEQRTEHQTEPAPEISRARLAMNTFAIYRQSGWKNAIRQAWRALRQRT